MTTQEQEIEKEIEDRIRKDMSIQTHIKKMWWQPYFKELSNKCFKQGQLEERKRIFEILQKLYYDEDSIFGSNEFNWLTAQIQGVKK